MDPIHTGGGGGGVINCPNGGPRKKSLAMISMISTIARARKLMRPFKNSRAREEIVARKILIRDIIFHPFSTAFFRENIIDESLTDRFRDRLPSAVISLRTRKLYVYARWFTMTN